VSSYLYGWSWATTLCTSGVGLVWLFFADDGAAGEEVTIRQEDRPYRYQLAAMLCFLIFADNLLGRIEGPGETVWLWLRSGSLVFSVWCASFCSGLGLFVRAIAESAESSGPPQSRISSTSNTMPGIIDSTSFLTKRDSTAQPGGM
jgi:hypothetical protein